MKNIDKLKINCELEINSFTIRNGFIVLNNHFRGKNEVVDDGLEKVCLLLGNSGASNYISQIGFGTGTAAEDASDTGLTNQFLKAVEGITYPTTNSLEVEFDLDLLEYNGNVVTEYGLFTADSTLFSRKVKSAISKEDTIYISGTWTITVSYSA